ncbi:MAG: sigma-70 family polymerase sigma factor [Nevskia sp.]|nr:sigma-70 family polymerase sigma factor [Nevskia sp.]
MGEHLRDDQKQRYHGGQSQPGRPGSARATELSQLFEQHNRTLVAFLANRMGNEAEAKEVAQEAYVRMLQLNEPGAVSFLRAYLFRTAANIALDRIRHRACSERFDVIYDPDDLTNQLGPDREVLARDELKVVRRALLELPPNYRRAFLLSRFEEKSTEEIGRELGIKDTQTRLYLRRAVAYCRLRMDGLTEAEAKERVFP